MKGNTTFRKIDMVLSYICNANEPPFRKDGDITKDLIEFQNNFKELHEILLKLEMDNYIKSYIELETNIKMYYSTFDGRLFLEKGAYEQQYINDKQKLKELELIEKISNRNNTILTWGTVCGSIIALVLLVFEILKYFSCNCSR